MELKESYLGDGLYASYDGYQVILRAPREVHSHYIALDEDTFRSLLRYVERIFKVKIYVERIVEEQNDDRTSESQ